MENCFMQYLRVSQKTYLKIIISRGLDDSRRFRVRVDDKKRRNLVYDRKFDSLLFRYFLASCRRRKEARSGKTDCALLFCVLRRGARGCPPSKQDVWHSYIRTHSPLFNCYIYKGLSRRRTHGGSSAPGLENSVVFGHRYWTCPSFHPSSLSPL